MNKKRRRGKSLVTLHDVAQHAGVSPMTVSRFLDGSRSVRDAARVKTAIDELGYSPNTAARSLASSGAIRLGLLYGNHQRISRRSFGEYPPNRID
jgi:LacI family transcriptional regulator